MSLSKTFGVHVARISIDPGAPEHLAGAATYVNSTMEIAKMIAEETLGVPAANIDDVMMVYDRINKERLRRSTGADLDSFPPAPPIERMREQLEKWQQEKIAALVIPTTGIDNLDRVLESALVPGSITLLVGPRGLGKTTLCLQIANAHAAAGPTLFGSGEMTKDAMRDFADRLEIKNHNVNLYGDAQSVDIENLVETAVELGAKLLIVDSLQTTHVSGYRDDVVGKLKQQLAIISMLKSFAQRKKVTVLVIGHVNKSGEIAKTVHDAVNHVLYLEQVDDIPASMDNMVRVLRNEIESGVADECMIKLTPTGFVSAS